MHHHHLTATEAANIHDRVKTDILNLYRACEGGPVYAGENPARDFFIDLSVELGQKGILVSMVDYAINPTAMVALPGEATPEKRPVPAPRSAIKPPIVTRGRRSCTKRMRNVR